ncbi:MAG: hypothetical protein BGO01_20315 [Armatimonadetes bacterium 55-13]|nr:efflux RND transporter periplasmic adaptor subunit [Armatimonadota bacterium]OJU64457.1 MAG: hypothetical protein BGO01_20315 [Armatimonadetes bacterium 55-13]
MKSKLIWIVGLLLVAALGYWWVNRGKDDGGDIEYRYAKVERGEIVRSISATGQLVASTTVDIKSKAGGKVVRLAVDEGTFVKKGDLIAEIDPSDTQATYDQASADLTSAQARASQAEANYELQVANSQTSIADAKAALETARVRLAKAKLEAQRQPALTQAAIKTAQAGYDSAVEAKRKLEVVTIPQRRRDAQGTFDRTKADLDVAQAEYDRQKRLLDKGFTTKATLEKAVATLQSARSAFDLAQQELSTLDKDIKVEQATAVADVSRAKAALDQAKANASEIDLSKKSVVEAEKAVKSAEISLQKAQDDAITNRIRNDEVKAAKASTVRSRVSVENAKVQLDSTTVLAPRDGVVTTKYLEEGTIIPPGTSTFAQGTSIVQLSDVTTMYVECAVVEADISQVKVGQQVRIVTEAFRASPAKGIVTRVNPAATTENNITAVKVRIKVVDQGKDRLLPGMTATCEFITLSKPNVLVVPSQAVERDGGKNYVQIKSTDPKKPRRVEVKVGETGNEGTEIVDGLKEGDEVVTATIDLAQLRETQQKMEAAAEGGGLAGGQGPRNRSSSSRTTTTRSR